MSQDTPTFSPASIADMAAHGGRHYRGAGLGPQGEWACPACGAANTGPIPAGCVACPAGRPGVAGQPMGGTHAAATAQRPAVRQSPFVAAATQGAAKINRVELLTDIRHLVREELAAVFAQPAGQLTVSSADAYALRAGLEIVRNMIAGGLDDPQLPNGDQLEALHAQLFLAETQGGSVAPLRHPELTDTSDTPEGSDPA